MEWNYQLIILHGLFIDGFSSVDFRRMATVSTSFSLNECKLVEEYKKTP